MEEEKVIFEEKSVSIGNWIITMLITSIPLVGVIMLFVWAFGGNVAKSKENWAKASLIFILITIVILFIFWSNIIALIVGNSGSYR